MAAIDVLFHMDGDGVRRAFWLLRSALRVGRGEFEAALQQLLPFSGACSCRVSQQSLARFHEGAIVSTCSPKCWLTSVGVSH